jgi:hypothetical protein
MQRAANQLRLPTVAIFITAVSWAGFAIWLGVNPDALLPAFGVEESTPQMLTEVRAFYGGVEMAIAVAMIVLWKRTDLFASLLVGGLPLVGSASGRLRVIPGSHISSTSDGIGVDNAIAIHASVGDVLAMRPLISHASGSSVEGTRRHRRILHLEFAADALLPDGIAWHDFISSSSHQVCQD